MGGGGTGDDLDYMHARFCSPVTGRFLSVDRHPAKAKSPQSWNRYLYAHGNPTKFVDPDGKSAVVFIVAPSRDDVKGVFGHAAIFVRSGNRSSGISYGGNHAFEKGTQGFIAGYVGEGRTVTMYVLKTSAKQDKQMLGFIGKNPDGNTDRNAPGADLMLRENCTKAVCNTLQEGGVIKRGEDADGAMSMLHAPSELQQSLQTGELSDDVEAVVIFDPEADAKAQKSVGELTRSSCFYSGACPQ